MAVTGATYIEASKKMYEKTIEEVKSKDKTLLKDITNIYRDKLKFLPSLEPKMTNRWGLRFPKEYNILDSCVKGLNRPSYPFNVGDEITVILRDFIATSTTENIFNLAENKKPFKLKIEVLDPLAEVIEKWVLKGCLIKSVEWSPLDYETKDISKIYVNISYNEIKIKNK